MEEVSKRIQNLSESQTIAMAQRSRELKAEGKDIISLSLGEPDFNTPDFIKEAAKKAIDENYTKYTPVPGYLELREAISKKFKRDNGLDYKTDQIVVSTGAKQSLANVVLSLVNPGDEVIIPSPYWVSYLELVKLAEGIPVIVESGIEQDFKINAEQLKRAITPRTKLMIFSSPCNPSGSIFSKAELKELANVIAAKEDFYVISDEIYEHINFVGKHESIAQFDNIYNQVITVNGVSKGFSMTGWRLGYIGAPKWIADACSKIQGQFTSGTNSITQRAVITALEADPSVTNEMNKAFKERRDLVLKMLNEIPGIETNEPEGAFYVFPNISSYFGKQTTSGGTIKDATDFSMYLLNEAQVAVVTGEAFGNPNCIRLSYATSNDQLIKAINRIADALQQLK
ncbi:MAG: aspartate aminotransferase [Flavobacteriales bacterium]|nr:aspartate aminotransferase [Flavobacteriales bacterium]|tara:strand:- start:15147 stop:16343 length:1197 start_codon:yes stop_codon:yes gene_type:complete